MASSLARGVFIVGAKRTAFGAMGGRLLGVNATELAEIASRAALTQAKVATDKVDSVAVGNVIQISSKGGAYISRHLALRLGLPLSTACLTVNRLCGSGFQALVNGTQDICMGDSEIVLTSGTENMSQTPFLMRDARFGVKFTQVPEMECALWGALTDQHVKLPMGITAENLAAKYKISREDCDKFALISQQRWKAAQDAGKFKDEITPVMVKVKGQQVPFEVDEHPRPQSTPESLAKLPPVFKKDGTVTAGNASGVCDGAAAVVLASEEAVKANNLKPLARVVGYSSVGCDPTIMGIGPVPSIQRLLQKTGVTLGDIAVTEVNEAFAPQFLSVQRELGLDLTKTNVNGGAIALGHPIGASGSRIVTNLVHELQRMGPSARYALGSACIGGGQGISVLLERC